MKHALLYATLWIAAASSAFAASTRIIPVAGHIPGANNTSWRTDVSLSNNTNSTVTVELVFHPDNGVARSRTILVEGGSSVLLDDAVAPEKFPGTNPTSWLGQLEVRASGDVSASAHIFTQGPNGGTFGSTYEGFDPAILSTGGAIAGLVNGGRFRSNVAFTNPADSAITVQYTLRTADGSVAGNRSFELPAHATKQLSLGQDVGTSAREERFSLFWSATGRSYAVASIIDNRSGDPTSAPSVSRDATSLFFPVVGRTAGGSGTFWSTSASVTGTSGVMGSATFAYTDAATGHTFTRTTVLPSLGSVTTEDVNEFVGAPAGTGSLRVTATAPLAAVVRVFNTLANGSTFGSSVLAQDELVRSTAVRIEGVRRDTEYRLNVAIANDQTQVAEGSIRLFDEHGAEVETRSFRAEPGKSLQVGLTGAALVRAGEVRVESSNGVAVTAIASNVDNVTGDTIQRESAQEAERQSELEIVMSTRTAAIGAPVSFSLKHAGSNVASVLWQFGDGSTASGPAVSHVFAAAGEFNVTVEVTLPGGAVVRDREDLRVASGSSTPNPAGSAIDFTYTPANPAPGEQVVFTATGATSGGFFKWKFPGDIRPIGNTVTFTFPNAGAFQVEVEIEHGATVAEITRIVTVGGTPTGTPGAGPIDFTFSPSNPQAGQPVTFTASGSTGGGVFKWKFPGNVRAFGTTATFTFPSNGSFEVEVEIEHGSILAEITKIVTVGGTGTNPNPTGPGTGTAPLSFTFAPAAPTAGQAVTFTASGSTFGGVYKWKFPGDVRLFGSVVTFTFSAAGSYRVELEIEHGSVESEISKTVVVSGGSGTNPSDPGTTAPLNFTYSPASPRVGQAVTFTATGSTGGGTYEWEFPNGVKKSGAVVTFTFTTAGTHEVELEVEHGSIDAKVEKRVTVSP